MGTRAEDDYRRSEHSRLRRDPELVAALERRLQREAERATAQAAARRSRLYSLGLAGGRRAVDAEIVEN